MRLFLITFILFLSNGTAYADKLDEAAKCAATFRILTSLRVNNEALADHFANQGLISRDIMSIYMQANRNRIFTNGETQNLIIRQQTELDQQRPNGQAFIPYLKSCTGWNFKFSKISLSDIPTEKKAAAFLKASDMPILDLAYPHPTWPEMQELFLEAHRIWADLGKK